jgi:hypothetical protein
MYFCETLASACEFCLSKAEIWWKWNKRVLFVFQLRVMTVENTYCSAPVCFCNYEGVAMHAVAQQVV